MPRLMQPSMTVRCQFAEDLVAVEARWVRGRRATMSARGLLLKRKRARDRDDAMDRRAMPPDPDHGWTCVRPDRG